MSIDETDYGTASEGVGEEDDGYSDTNGGMSRAPTTTSSRRMMKKKTAFKNKATNGPGVSFQTPPPGVSSSSSSRNRGSTTPTAAKAQLEDLLRQSRAEHIGSNEPFVDYNDLNLIMNNSIMLPHIIVPWKDQSLRNRITLYLWLLSGLEPCDIRAKILQGGEKLRIQFAWPDQLQDAMSLTKARYCKGSSKVVEIETIVKNLKGGSASTAISSVIDFDLGMRVEEQFHYETVLNVQGERKEEYGNVILRYFKKRLGFDKKNKGGRGNDEYIPLTIQKFEMMGIRDNYHMEEPYCNDYEDESVIAPPAPRMQAQQQAPAPTSSQARTQHPPHHHDATPGAYHNHNHAQHQHQQPQPPQQQSYIPQQQSHHVVQPAPQQLHQLNHVVTNRPPSVVGVATSVKTGKHKTKKRRTNLQRNKKQVLTGVASPPGTSSYVASLKPPPPVAPQAPTQTYTMHSTSVPSRSMMPSIPEPKDHQHGIELQNLAAAAATTKQAATTTDLSRDVAAATYSGMKEAVVAGITTQINANHFQVPKIVSTAAEYITTAANIIANDDDEDDEMIDDDFVSDGDDMENPQYDDDDADYYDADL